MRFRRRFLLIAAILLALGVWGAWWLVSTTPGARSWLPIVLRHAIPAKQFHLGAIDGSLLNGLRLSKMSIAELPGWWGKSRIVIEGLETSSLLQALSGQGGLRLHDVQWTDAPFAADVSVQRIEIQWPIQWDRVQLIENARLRLPLSEPILLAGSQQHGRFDLKLYAKTLDVHEVVALLTHAPAWQSLAGIVNDLDVSIEGPVNGLMWRGSWQVTRLSRYDFTITECPGTFTLTMRGLPATLTTEGDITCQAGTVSSRQTVASLLPSQVVFTPTAVGVSATFDVQATSTVGGTPIRMALRGTTQQPDLRLTSTPPLPQGVLLAMLVTGKQWKGAQDALTQGVISSDLALDFIDYFVLGGLSGKIANRFGISGLSLRHNPETNRVGVETTLVDKLSVGVEVEPSTLIGISGTPSPPSTPTDATATRSPIPYKVGAEYKVNETTALSLEGERTVLDHTASTSASPADAQTQPAGPQTDDKVLLKFKKQF